MRDKRRRAGWSLRYRTRILARVAGTSALLHPEPHLSCSALLTLFTCLIVVQACSSGQAEGAREAPEGKRKRAGGPLVPWDVELVRMGSSDGPSSNWSAVNVAIGGVEWLTHDGSSLDVRDVDPPGEPRCEDSFPISLEAVDFERDGVLELLVADPSCGYWMVKHESDALQSRRVEQRAPSLPTLRHLTWVHPSGESRGWLFAGEPNVVHAVELDTDGWRTIGAVQVPAPWSSVQIASLMVALPDGRLPAATTGESGVLVQQRGAFQPVIVTDGALGLPAPIRWGTYEPEQLAPFDAFDHLQEARSCGSSVLLGIGMYEGATGSAATPLMAIRLLDGTAELHEIGDGIEARAFALAQRGSETWLGVLTDQGTEQTLSTLMLDRTCEGIQTGTMHSVPVRLERGREALDPEQRRSADRFRGTRIVGEHRQDGAIQFSIYDGSALHVFEVGTADAYEPKYQRYSAP